MYYFDEYERCLKYVNQNERPCCMELPANPGILLQFCAYSLLRGFSVADWNETLFYEFLSFVTESKSDSTMEILMQVEDRSLMAALVDCCYSIETIRDVLLSMSVMDSALSASDSCAQLSMSADNTDSHAQLSAALTAPGVTEQLFSISLTGEKPVLVHISDANPTVLHMFTFPEYGTFLCIGAKVNLAQMLADHAEASLEIFKALGDASRLRIAHTLLQSPMTVSELAQTVGISMSTINHHLKTLMAAGVVLMETGTSAGRGVRYGLNRPRLLQLAQHFASLLQEEK